MSLFVCSNRVKSFVVRSRILGSSSSNAQRVFIEPSSRPFLSFKRYYAESTTEELPHLLKDLPSEKKVSLEINGRKLHAPLGSSIIEACKYNGVYVPSLCYHPLLRVVGTCRVCLVSADGKLTPACYTKAQEGMVVETHSQEVEDNVKQVLQFLRCRHPNACMTCEVDGHCEFQNLVYRYQVEEYLPSLFHRDRSDVRDTSSHAVVRDMNKCILCSRCVRACSDVQGMNVYEMTRRDQDEIVSTFGDVPLADTGCISCGQCTAVCPVGALIEKSHIHYVDQGLKNKGKKIYIAQTAPAVRVAISEEFGMEPGSISTGKLVAALKKLGFDYVFDTNFTADLTIMEEATEFIHRFTTKQKLPMFTSCCPGWINLVEKHYPKLEPHLSSCKSPQGMLSTLIKTYFAKKIGVDPLDIIIVSIMPCVAKKDEIKRPQLTREFPLPNGGTKRVAETDFVLTTRETAHLIERNKIHYISLPETDYDSPLGESTGSAVLFGTTGGVMEAALRTAYFMITGKDLEHIELRAVRGLEGVRDAVVNIAGLELKIGIVHGTKNILPIIEEILEGKSKYDFLEFMACPGGCIGGGGEPKTSDLDRDILKKRQQAVLRADKNSKIRSSHHNPSVKKLYEEFLQGKPNSHESHEYLHTYYTDRSSTVKTSNILPFKVQQQDNKESETQPNIN